MKKGTGRVPDLIMNASAVAGLRKILTDVCRWNHPGQPTKRIMAGGRNNSALSAAAGKDG